MAKKTLNYNDIVEQIHNKLDEILERYDAFKRGENINGEKVSPNTARTQLNILSRELKTLRLIRELIKSDEEEITLEVANAEFLLNLISLTGTRITTIVKVEEGDSLMDLMSRYPKVQNLLDKATKAANKAGLVLGADGIYHKATI